MDNLNLHNHTAYREISNAVNDALFLIKDKNMNPTEAVIKSAEDNNLNIHKAARVSETINTAMTLKHFENNPDNKGDTFPISDTAEVLDSIGSIVSKFSNEDQLGKAKAEIEKEMEMQNFLQATTRDSILKDKITQAVELTNFENLREDELQSNVFPAISILEQEADYLSDIFHEADFQVQTGINKLATIFSRVDSPDAVEFMKYAQLKYQDYGMLVKTLLSHLNVHATNFMVKESYITKTTSQVNFVDKEAQVGLDDFMKHAMMMVFSKIQLENTIDSVLALKKK
jgi:hypothetical protein